MVTLTINNSVKKRNFNKKPRSVTGREHRLLNHPALDPFDYKGSTYFKVCSNSKSQLDIYR